MRQVTKKGLLTVAAASGVLAMATGTAHADADASGISSNSPGVGSGNTVQAPVHVPVNVCGNTINVVGLLNPSFGNTCVNGGSGGGGNEGAEGSGAEANGVAQDSPGVGSGNNVQAPVEVPVNACGNTVDIVGVLNPAMGNKCENGNGPEQPEEPPAPEEPEEPPAPEEPEQPPAPEEPEQPEPEAPPAPEQPEQPEPAPSAPEEEPEPIAMEPEGELAETGSNSALLVALPLGAGLVAGGVVLYRRRARLVSRG